MAKDSSFGEILTLALLGGSGYLAWKWWSSQTTPAPATTPSTTPTTPATTPGAYVPPTIMQLMQTAANSNSIIQAQGGQADAYQWAELWKDPPPNGAGQTPLDVGPIFFKSGMPAPGVTVPNASQQNLPLLTLTLFLEGLKSAGINPTNLGLSGWFGLGQAPRLIPVPVIIGRNRTILNLPAGTTPADLQARLRQRRGQA